MVNCLNVIIRGGELIGGKLDAKGRATRRLVRKLVEA
jgi:hypothetical protein